MGDTNTSKYAQRTTTLPYRHRYKKCFSSLSWARRALLLHQYNDCVTLLYDAMEFFWKTLRQLKCGDAEGLKAHLPTRPAWDSVMPELTTACIDGSRTLLTISELNSLEKLYIKYNPKWHANPQERSDPRYGNKQCDTLEAKEQFSDVMLTLPSTLARINRQLTVSKGNITVGVLNGYFGIDRDAEMPCADRPWASYSGAGPEGWVKLLRDHQLVKGAAHLIAITEMEPHYNIVVNPFGEAYPEHPIGTMFTPGYEMIKDYIFSGGVFVTAGGNPFYYLFDTQECQMINTSVVIPRVDVEWQDQHGKRHVGKATAVANQFLRRDFGVDVTMTPKPQHRDRFPVNTYQLTEDKQYWNCQVDLHEVQMFRALYPPSGGNATPILRATVAGEDIYPVGFVRYGSGLLLHIGLAVVDRKEFEVATAAVADGLIRNFERYFG